MKNSFLSFLYSAFASLALVSAAVAETTATFTLYTPRYYKDSLLVSADPGFILGPRGSFKSGESFPSSATYTVDASALSQAHPGYYVSKWVLSTAWGAGTSGTVIQTQTGGTSFSVTFDYKWAAKYGTQLDLTVYLSPITYSVSYDANGGAWTGSEPEAGPWKYSAGGMVPGEQDVSRSGYALTGWASNKGKTISPGESFTGASLGVTSDGQEVLLTAQWSAQPYTATVAAGEGGSGGCTVDYSYSENQSQSKAITLPTRTGHAISSWTATGYGGSAPTILGTTLTIPAKTSGDFTMTPTWKADACLLRVVKGTGIAQVVCDFTRAGVTCHETTSYDATYSVDFGTAWSASAVAAEGYSTDASASGTMTAAGATFSPTARPNDYSLRLTLGTGISNIWYRVGLASDWIWTTNNIVVPVAYGSEWQAYAEPAEGYAYTTTSMERPASGKMTTAGASFEPVGTVKSYDLRLEMTPGIEKICYKVGVQKHYDETTTSLSVPVEYGTAWSAYALAVEGCSTNETCAASGTMGAAGEVFRPRVNAKPYTLTITPGTGIATIFYKTNETQRTWCSIGQACTVPVLFGDTWSAYALAADGYTYAETSEAFPKTGVMTTEGDAFSPSGVANTIWVRYDRNGGGDAGRMDDSEFTYDVEAPLRLNAYARSYEIHYNGNGGTCAHENDISGYAFAGWRDTPDGQEGAGHYSYSDGQRVTNPCGSKGAAANDPVILYAQWKPKAVTLPLPVRAGYDFSGWYTLSSGGRRVGGAGEPYMAADDITLYAHWRTHVTKLSFVVDDEEKAEFAHAVANGGTFEDFGSLPELTSDDPKKTFRGWYTAPEGGTRITDTTTVNLSNDAVTLYAQWETSTYAITYETNGGTIDEYAKSGYSPGQAFALPTDVTRTGRDFLGWYDNPTFEGEPVAGITSGMTGDKTFYAKWSAVAGDTVSLTFVNVSGYSFYTNTSTKIWYWQTLEDKSTPRLSETYAKGELVTLPRALFTQEGIRQVGWRLEGSNKTNPDTWTTFGTGEDLGVFTQNSTFHTIWETNTYTVVYNGNGGTYANPTAQKGKTELKQGPFMYGTEVPVSDASESWERTNYTCIGWAYTPGGHAVYGGGEKVYNLTAVDKGVVTLYAVWEKKKVAEESPVPPASKLTAVRTHAPMLLASTTPSAAPLSYTIHFSPGAVVVNPQAMTNWTVSGGVTLPDCLYTNVQGSSFAGWTYNGKSVESPFTPDLAFDGQVVTVTAAWKPLECGDLSDAVGLTNAVLTCTDGTWQKCTEGEEVHSGTTCLKAEIEQASSDLKMQVTGPGELTYWLKQENTEKPISNVVDGVSTVIVVSAEKTWEKKSLVIFDAGEHTIAWHVSESEGGYATYWLDDVRWEPEIPEYALKATALEGGKASVNGESFVAGAEATLTAEANSGWLFMQWNDGSTNPVHKVTVWGDITNYVARFVKEETYHISVSAVPEAGGSVTGAGDYPAGTTTNLTATASNGWTFLYWSDGSADPTNTITVQGEAGYAAYFTNVYEVTAEAGNGGSVAGGGRYAAGTEATLTATANDGYKFVQWSDGSTENPHTITVQSNATFTATFEESDPPGPGPTPTTGYYYVAYDGNGADGGTMAEQTNICGVVAALVSNAFVRAGYAFDGWIVAAGKTAGATYADGETVTDDLATTNRAALLKAVWKPVKYQINFDPGVGRGTMDSLPNCSFGVGYQLPACTFACDKMAFSNWVDAAGTTYADGAIVRNLSSTGGVVTLYAVWSGHGQAFVNITGHTATKRYTGRPFTVSGYDVNISSEGYYKKDFTTAPGTVTTITETDVKYDKRGEVAKYCMGLSEDSFTNLVPSVNVVFDVTDGWLKILPSQIGGEPQAAASPKLSAFDGAGVYGKAFDASAIWKGYQDAYKGDVARVEFAAAESGPWSTNAPVMTVAGATSIWYRVYVTGYEPYVHELAINVAARPVSDATATVSDQRWTGRPLTPGVEVKVEGEGVMLAEGIDYYLTYENNTDPGEATVFVHGTGNWQGVSSARFNIIREITEEPGSGVLPIGGLSKYDVTAAYDGAAHTVDAAALTNAYAAGCAGVRVTFGTTDAGPWTVIPAALTDAGKTSFWYRVEANYCMPYVHVVQVTVTPRDLSRVTVASIPEQAWTGSAITPPVTVTDGEPSIVTEADYDVAYSDNVAPGTAAVTLTGKRNYTGTKTANFTIHRDRSRVRVTITGHTATAAYDGRAHTASGYDFVSTSSDYTAADFRCKGTTLVSQTNVGTACANLGASDFENLDNGFDVEFVVARDISVTVMTGAISGEPGSGTVPAGGLSKFDTTCVYDGQPHTLDVAALTKAFGEAYGAVSDIAYATAGTGPWSASPIAITDAGTTSFWYRVQVRNFTPFVHETKVTVMPRDIGNATVAPIPDQIATGEPIEPEVTVTDGKPSIITAADYDVGYSDNVAVGTATVTLTGKGNYEGTLKQTFEIVSKPGYYVVGYGEQVSIDLQADFPDRTIKSVSGLPSGLKYKNGYVTGKATKAVTEKVATVTFTDRTKENTYWTVKAGENYGVKIDFGESATGETSAAVGVGTAVEWTVTAAEGAKVTISNLPTGLKYNKTTGLITGTPTKAKEYKMTVKTVVNGLTVTQTFYITVEALPAMMVGTYYGVATVGGGAGQFQLKLAATGKATGYFYAAGKKISLKSTELVYEGEDCYAVKVTYKYNRATYEDTFLLMNVGLVDDVDLWIAVIDESEALDDVDATRDVIKETKTKVPAGTYPVVDESLEEDDDLMAKVTSKGAVKVSGKAVDEDGKAVSVTCSTQMVFDEEGSLYCWITVYKVVSKKDPIERCFKWYLPVAD